MSDKIFPMTDKAIIDFAAKVGTPFHIYDESRIRNTVESIQKAFSWNDGFINYFAVKALPNVNIMKLLGSLGFGADCSSLPELIIAEQAGIPGERIMFTSNDTPDEEFRAAYELGAILNLDDITHSCTHALRLANRLLDVYKTFEPNELLNETPFRLDAFLDGISNDFKRKANAKALMFEYEREGCGVTVKGDVDKLEQVMDNLLSNAVKFTNSGTVRFRAVYANGTLAVEISDTDMGMDEETLGRVFRPFERAAQDVNSEGFGLGLAITKGLMNADFLEFFTI